MHLVCCLPLEGMHAMLAPFFILPWHNTMQVSEHAAHASDDATDGTQNSVLYMYHSSVDPTAHDNMGACRQL